MRDLTPERLTRLLAMLTYFGDGRSVTFEEAATHFGITEKQLLQDIDTLWVSGAPGYTHSELIDFEASAFDDGLIRLREAQQMDRPLRLAPSEAIALLVALNSLIAKLGSNESLVSARDKLRRAAGSAARAAEAVHLSHSSEEILRLRAVVERAITAGERLQIRYASGRDEVRTRTIDPHVLNAVGDHWVLGAWCHLAQAERTFRLDRILEYEEVHEPITSTYGLSDPLRIDSATFTHEVTLRLRPPARWVTEQIPVLDVIEHADSFSVRIGSASPQWLEQLCLRLGDAVLEISPPDVRARVAHAARDALALYGQ